MCCIVIRCHLLDAWRSADGRAYKPQGGNLYHAFSRVFPCHLWGNPTRFNAHTSCCRALSLWRGVVMNSHVKRDPMGWYGHTPRYGVMINGHDAYHPRGCGCDKWAMIRQPHRGCTFDSPGLLTIGGYPGEQGVRDATPLGVVLSFCVLSNTSHATIRGVASS